jgi:hypothetical protein
MAHTYDIRNLPVSADVRPIPQTVRGTHNRTVCPFHWATLSYLTEFAVFIKIVVIDIDVTEYAPFAIIHVLILCDFGAVIFFCCRRAI